jgi:hypothetical protein
MDEQTWIDKFAIQELVFRYADSINRGDLDVAESVFAPNAVWESPVLGMHFESAREFRDFLGASSAGIELLIQTPHCPVVTLLGPDDATVTTTIYELSLAKVTEEGNPFGPVGTEINYESWSIYYDTLGRSDGTWLFTHRLFVPVYMRQGAATGDVTSARTGLRTLPA